LFGYVVENDKLEGLTLMLKNREVDFSVSALFINKARYTCMDYINARTWKFQWVQQKCWQNLEAEYSQKASVILLTKYKYVY